MLNHSSSVCDLDSNPLPQIMSHRWLLLLLALLLFSSTGCRPGADEDGRQVIMRIGHAAPVAGIDAVLQVLSADPVEESARVGVRCDDIAQEVIVTMDYPTVWVCGAGVRLEELHHDSNSGDPRAITLRVWSEQFREHVEALAAAALEGEPAADEPSADDSAPAAEGSAAEEPAADEAPADEEPEAGEPAADEPEGSEPEEGEEGAGEGSEAEGAAADGASDSGESEE